MRCPFCNPLTDEIIARNERCYACGDRYPVSWGHLLVMPYRHMLDFFPMTPEERVALISLIDTGEHAIR